MRPRPTQNEERSKEDGRESRFYCRLAGSVNNTHNVSPAEVSVNVQGSAYPSETSTVPMPPNDVASTSRLEIEHGTETGQIFSNNLVTIRANATKEETEHQGLTSDQRDDIEGLTIFFIYMIL